jgi:hypothetical protein
MFERGKKRGQIAIFVIIGIIIVGAISSYFLLRGSFGISSIPKDFQEVFDYYDSCIESKTAFGISILGSQGGHMDSEYIPGSEYAPFSSQLNFLGFPVPYWYYVSGNGLIEQNVPSKLDMQKELGDYVAGRISECDFDVYYKRGYSIDSGNPKVSTTINSESVDVKVDSVVTVSYGNQTFRKESHNVNVQSKIGSLYDSAKIIYEEQMQKAFLENYSVDVLRLYAPVDNVELSCSPKIWRTNEVVSELKNALSANLAQIKFVKPSEKSKYFDSKIRIDDEVSILYTPTWPTKVEIYGEGVGDQIMSTKPVGNQAGMGIMGFCYLPYHFVYDVSFPVMFQIMNGNEIFQFPVVVVIDKNLPRNGIYTNLNEEEEFIDVCEYNTQEFNVNVYDNNLNKIDANLTYGCFNQQCDLGSTTGGTFNGKAPACVNGYLEANSGGYSTKKIIISSNEQNSAEVIMDKEFSVNFSVKMDGKKLDEKVLVVFTDDLGGSKSLVFPEVTSTDLIEGEYDVAVYVYSNSSIRIPASSKRECQEVPQTGILGFFGSTQEQCVDINLPETTIEQALVGGGKSKDYFLASNLEKGYADINVGSLNKPTKLEDLQENFEAFEQQGVDISFNEK